MVCKLNSASAKDVFLFQYNFWAALSENLTELSVIMHPADQPVRVADLTQLTQLTSLKLSLPMTAAVRTISDRLNLPGLRSLHLAYVRAKDLVLDCPRLRSLTMEYCYIQRHISLQASLENFLFRELSGFQIHDACPLSNLLGLTRLHCQKRFFDILPFLSGLRTLEVSSDDGYLPPYLPSSLWTIKYFVRCTWSYQSSWCSRELQHLEMACQLPELQSLALWHMYEWIPQVGDAVQKLKGESKAKVTIQQDAIGEELASSIDAMWALPVL